MSADAARAANIASEQAQRAEQLIGDLTSRVNDTVAAVEATVARPVREAYAMLQGLLEPWRRFARALARPPGRPPARKKKIPCSSVEGTIDAAVRRWYKSAPRVTKEGTLNTAARTIGISVLSALLLGPVVSFAQTSKSAARRGAVQAARRTKTR